MFIVLRLDEHDARQTLAAHLIEIGAVAEHQEAHELVHTATAESVAVVW